MVETIERRELEADEVSRLLAAHGVGEERSRSAVVIGGADPPRVWWANRTAVELFGSDVADRLDERLFGGAGRQGLAAAAERLVTDGGPRQERLRLVRGFATRTVPVTISRWSGPDQDILVLSSATGDAAATPDDVAADALRREPRPPEPLPPVSLLPAAEQDRPPALQNRPPALPEPPAPAGVAALGIKRFLWQTNASGSLVGVGDGVDALRRLTDGTLVGSPFAAGLESIGVSGTERLTAALAAQRSFSNCRIAWPLAEPGWETAVVLGAVPVRGEAGAFMGFRGFGVADFARLTPRAPAPEQASDAPHPAAPDQTETDQTEPEPPPTHPAPAEGTEPRAASIGVRASFSSAKVVALRPSRLRAALVSERPPSDGSAGEEGADRLREPEDLLNLSSTEQSNFDAIARALRKASAAAAAAGREPAKLAPGDAVLALGALPEAVLIECGGETVYVNAAFAALTGYPSALQLQEAGGRHHLLGGLDAAQIVGEGVESGFPIIAASGVVVAVEGRLVAVEWRGSAAEMLVLRPAPDRIAEKQALEIEVKRRATEAAEARMLLERTEDAVAVVDARGRVLSLNAAARALFGRANGDAIGESIGAFLSPDSQSAVLGAVFAAGAGGIEAEEVAVEAMGRRRGQGAPYQIRMRALAPGRVGLVVRDRSAGEALREESRQLRDELDNAAQTRADFLAKVSHEVRTPLNTIIGFAEMMLEERFGPVGNPRYLDYLTDIHDAGKHVVGLLGDLVDLSSVASGQQPMALSATDVNAVVGESVAELQGQAHRDRVIVRQSLAGNLPRALVDAEAMRQVMDNILSNAIQFNEPGGQVIVSTALAETGAVVVRVRDTGIGMSEAELAIAMEPFRQISTGKAGAGSGLGLPLTRALVEANHATLSIKSRKSEGTLVEVALQPAPGEARDAPAA